MVKKQIAVVAGCLLLGLILLPSAWAEEIDAKQALKQMLETRDPDWSSLPPVE